MNYVNRSSLANPGTQDSRVLGTLLSANLNSTADQVITIAGVQKYVIRKIVITNASTTLVASIAAGGLYTAAGKGGTTIVAAVQGYTVLTGSTKFLDLTIALTTDVLIQTAIFLSLTTANGSAATADIYIIGDVLA